MTMSDKGSDEGQKTSPFVLGADDDDVIRDERQRTNGPFARDEGVDHHRDNVWVGMGIHLPAAQGGPKKRRRRKHHKEKSPPEEQGAQSEGAPGDDAMMGPGQRVQFLLRDDEAVDGGELDGSEFHPLFTEMEELHEDEWRETARWVKFEEDVEEGGNRWSKPHVATLSLHSLFELRSCLMNGMINIELEAEDLPQIVDIMLDKMIAAHQLEFMYRDEVREALLRRHTHQYEKHHSHKGMEGSSAGGSSFINTVRSLADIGKSFSQSKNMHKVDSAADATDTEKGDKNAKLSLPKVGSIPRDVGKSESHTDPSKQEGHPLKLSSSDAHFNGKGVSKLKRETSVNVNFILGGDDERQQLIADASPNRNRSVTLPIHQHNQMQQQLHRGHFHSFMQGVADQGRKLSQAALPRIRSRSNLPEGNMHFLKKLPPGVEASNVLIGEVDFLNHHVSAFIRLKNAILLGDLTEVPVPTRFLFVLLGPTGHSQQYREIGRAIATLMSDEIFHDVAYKARSRRDLLDGVDEFLDQVTVLPPGEWDPNIRIEPPSHVPSQEKRRQEANLSDTPKDKDPNETETEPEEEGHGSDPALKRTGKPFGGLIADIKRKLPWYLSDYKDALNLQCLATFCFMYFALLAPIVTFGGLLEEATGRNMAAMENLFSGAVCGISYHLFSGQPLTIIGSTGPVLVFETIIYDMCLNLDINYMSFRWWVNAWTAVILIIMVVTDASSLVSYITRFTEESFATLIALIFIYEAIAKVFKILKTEYQVVAWNPTNVSNSSCFCEPSITHAAADWTWFNKTVEKYRFNLTTVDWYDGTNSNGTYVIDYDDVPLQYCERLHGELDGHSCYQMYDVFLMSLMLMLGTFVIAFGLKGAKNSCYFPSSIRQILSDFAVMIAIIVMVIVDRFVGVATPKLNVPEEFRPTLPGRGWVISPFGANKHGDTNPFWTAPLALAPALLACILIFMDQQITAVIVNRKENKFKKGCGYHLDLFVLAFLIFITGAFGIPIYVAATVLSINHVNSLRLESESRAPGEKPTFVGVREQRVTGIVTFLFIGLSVFLTTILGLIPMPVLYGVFLYMGIAALGGIQLFDRILLLFMPMKYQPDYIYLRHVPIRQVHMYTGCQFGCLAVLWVIKSTKSISIAFPIMLVVMIGIRKLMEKVFTEHDLKHLDDKMPDFHLRKKEDMKKIAELWEEEEKVRRQQEEDEPKLKPVATQAHLHIPMASGNVMKIPLSSVSERDEERPINISEEMNKSGVWKHIESETKLNKNGKPKTAKTPPTPPILDDDEPITIKIQKPSPATSTQNMSSKGPETQPLLKKKDDDKQESSV